MCLHFDTFPVVDIFILHQPVGSHVERHAASCHPLKTLVPPTLRSFFHCCHVFCNLPIWLPVCLKVVCAATEVQTKQPDIRMSTAQPDCSHVNKWQHCCWWRMLLQDGAPHWCLRDSKFLMPIRASKGPPSYLLQVGVMAESSSLETGSTTAWQREILQMSDPREFISTVPQCPSGHGVWACYLRGADVTQSPDSRHTGGHPSWRNCEPGAGGPVEGFKAGMEFKGVWERWLPGILNISLSVVRDDFFFHGLPHIPGVLTQDFR